MTNIENDPTDDRPNQGHILIPLLLSLLATVLIMAVTLALFEPDDGRAPASAHEPIQQQRD
ncbi:hypothetical protein [Actibacterium sp. 188UL27-1]|uniref:hypothetical protein n=1 Tax=Actibacterium sp. 188UL27-1 TaxID=2786961 RepID=UPI00195B1DF6|nr:hypothetical protein [Actibacterium sp. 188UL27-1]MBM7069916.1 hypothetical protein [Actibacterium sp. 188UL27-1]